MKEVKHIFLDLDRTLWDFEKNSQAALEQLYSDLNLKNILPSFEQFLKSYKEINAKYWELYGLGKVSKENLRIGRFLDTLASFQVYSTEIAEKLASGYVAISPYQTNLFPGTKEALNELKSMNLNLSIITNGFKEVQYIKLNNSGLMHFFDDILCSEDIGINKPNVEIFHAGLERNNVKKEQSIMVGDDFKADIIGATRAGIRSVLFDYHKQFEERQEIERITLLTELPSKIVGL